MTATLTATHSPLLGTDVELRLSGPHYRLRAAEDAALAVIHRLSEVFSIFDDSSELCRWRRGEVERPSTDLSAVLRAAEYWFQAGAGAFHPACQALRLRWLQAEIDQRLPDPAELRELSSLLDLPFRDAQPTGDCSGVDLNAIAKGYIVDRASAAALASGLDSVVINAGGDLAHRGHGGVGVGIEDPLSRYDNAPKLAFVHVSNAALATSGRAHRGFFINGRWFGHVIDPRTGWPVENAASASVLARDAMTADALATVAGVYDVPAAFEFLRLHDAAGLIVTSAGQIHTTGNWPTSPPGPPQG